MASVAEGRRVRAVEADAEAVPDHAVTVSQHYLTLGDKLTLGDDPTWSVLAPRLHEGTAEHREVACLNPRRRDGRWLSGSGPCQIRAATSGTGRCWWGTQRTACRLMRPKARQTATTMSLRGLTLALARSRTWQIAKSAQFSQHPPRTGGRQGAPKPPCNSRTPSTGPCTPGPAHVRAGCPASTSR